MASGPGFGFADQDVSKEVEDFTVDDIKHDSSRERSTEDGLPLEKGEIVSVDERPDDGVELLSHEEQFPIDPSLEEEKQQFTIRATFIGCCLGGVIAASK